MNYKFKTKPYAHQLKALEMSWNKEVFAYFMEMGTGKSKVLLDNIAMLYDKGKINGVLIIAPKGVYKNWYDSEIPIHLVDHIQKKSVLWQAIINQKQQRKLDTLFKSEVDLHILIMNVEAFSTKKGLDFANKFLLSHNALVAVDESTTIKNPQAKRTRNILQLSKLSKYRRILTGSPVTKSPLDLYTQCHFLDSYLLDFSSYYAFRNRYAEMRTAHFGGRSIQIVAGYKNLPELAETLKPFSYRILKDDCLDLPPKTFMKRVIQLTPEQKKVYAQMKSMALAEMNGKMITTVNVTEDRQKAIKEIQDPESKVRFLVGTPQTGGYGITLTGASTMIYYSNGYDLEKRQQSEARIDRIGQEKPMTYIDILAEDTIDEKIVKALRKKVNIATEIMGEELKAWI
jgi:SNF2 family DNA or RNA helicase